MAAGGTSWKKSRAAGRPLGAGLLRRYCSALRTSSSLSILNSFSLPPHPRTLMRLIWSALWGAFPGEIHLISEFLIPSLGAPASAPLAAPREVRAGGRARAAKAGPAREPCTGPVVRTNHSRPQLRCWRQSLRSGPYRQRRGSHASAFSRQARQLWAGDLGTCKTAEGRPGYDGGVGSDWHLYRHFCPVCPGAQLGARKSKLILLEWSACA